MKQVIHKFPLKIIEELQTITLPIGSRVLKADILLNVVNIWVLKADNKEQIDRQFRVIPTGFRFDSKNLNYVSTVIDTPLVWHVFEYITIK